MKVGIVGGGQLARMLILAGYPLDLRFQVLDPAADACAGQVAPLLQGAYDDEACLKQLADWADVVTFDFENVPAAAALALAQQVAVYPPPTALATAPPAGRRSRMALSSPASSQGISPMP